MGILSVFRKPAQTVKAAARRSFEAAAVNRLTASWLGAMNTIDEDISSGGDRLRSRARDLAQNNDYVRRYLSMVARNVVGPSGFRLQARVLDGQEPDRGANRAIEQAFKRWKQKADASGRMPFDEMCRQLVRTVARDGEALVLVIRSGNEFGYSLQVIDPQRLDTTYSRAAAGRQNAIRMGVEVDRRQRPVAYWLRDGKGNRKRYPADQIIHLFRQTDPEQTRGYSWMHTAMMRLHHLKGYEEAAVIASRIGASKMGFYTSPDGVAPSGEDQGNGDFIRSAEPGEFEVLPEGYQFQQFDPTYPHAQYEMFTKACLRGIASGLDVSYVSLANDLKGVNYSSIRAGVLEERDHWMTLQDWFISQFLEPVYAEWLRLALMSGQVTLDNGSALPASSPDRFMPHEWQGRRWKWVDPQKDVTAAVIAIDNRLKSRSAVAAEEGVDIEDVFAQMQKEEQIAARYGIDLPPAEGRVPEPVSDLPTD